MLASELEMELGTLQMYICVFRTKFKIKLLITDFACSFKNLLKLKKKNLYILILFSIEHRPSGYIKELKIFSEGWDG